MSLLETILNSNSGVIGQMAKKLGVPEGMATLAVSALAPALTRGLKRNATQPGGLDSLIGALGSGNHQRYVEEPQTLEDESSIADGNAILGHIFGSKDVSRNVAGGAAKQTGIDSDLLKRMLPMVAGVAMGALAKETKGGSQLERSSQSTDPLGMLSGLLGSSADDSEMDDVLNLKKKYV